MFLSSGFACRQTGGVPRADCRAEGPVEGFCLPTDRDGRKVLFRRRVGRGSLCGWRTSSGKRRKAPLRDGACVMTHDALKKRNGPAWQPFAGKRAPKNAAPRKARRSELRRLQKAPASLPLIAASFSAWGSPGVHERRGPAVTVASSPGKPMPCSRLR